MPPRAPSGRKHFDTQFQGILEAAPDAMVVADEDGVIVLANAQAVRLFHYEPDEMLGQLLEVLIPERYRAQHPGHRQKYFHDPRVRPMGIGGLDLFARRKDGSEIPVEISLSPLTTPQGVLAITAIRDITERRKGEERIQSSLLEKEALLKEIHHRVKNNLQVTSSLLRLQAGFITDEKAKEMFAESQNRIRSMALVHEKLYHKKAHTFSVLKLPTTGSDFHRTFALIRPKRWGFSWSERSSINSADRSM